MEVTQFTYFQQAGGKPLSAPAVEITYGLERILMNLQGVHHFKDIVYAPGITYGELFMQNEYEMSVYNLDEADVEDQRARFVLFEKVRRGGVFEKKHLPYHTHLKPQPSSPPHTKEAKRLLERRLPIPAFDHLLKLSHTFNILDARGAVGVTERANSFAALRALARQVTALWLERREELEHPLGVIPPLAGPPEGALPEGVVEGPTSPFVLEVGSEELPPEDVESVMVQLRCVCFLGGVGWVGIVVCTLTCTQEHSHACLGKVSTYAWTLYPTHHSLHTIPYTTFPTHHSLMCIGS